MRCQQQLGLCQVLSCMFFVMYKERSRSNWAKQTGCYKYQHVFRPTNHIPCYPCQMCACAVPFPISSNADFCFSFIVPNYVMSLGLVTYFIAEAHSLHQPHPAQSSYCMCACAQPRKLSACNFNLLRAWRDSNSRKGHKM